MMRKRGRPFEPGQSGNPHGRPKTEICLTKLLRAALAERDEGGKRTKARAIIDALIEQAIEGKTAAIQQIFGRTDGIIQPILEESVLDLEAIAQAMKTRYASIRPDGPPVRDAE
jgi:Family of unknown function (DUF5681)